LATPFQGTLHEHRDIGTARRGSVTMTRLRITGGEINAFIGLVVDNLSVLAFLAGALIGIFHFPAEIIYTRMFPGTALGALLGNLVYTRMALRSGRAEACAMPLGIDAPTTIGIALLVLGPAFLAFKQQGMDEAAAAEATWHLGMASMVVMGVLKTVLSFFGAAVLRAVPRAGLLGSIAAIALVLMGFFPLVEILRVPVVGLVCLGIVLYALVAQGRLPWRMPGVLFSVLVGLVLYYGLGAAGLLGTGFHPPAAPALRFNLPWPNVGFIDGLRYTPPYLALIVPFGLLMVVGGINVTESARAAGDDYRVRDILLTEALATLVAGVCGGVAQTTPYIGQPAYRAMGGRSAYTLLTGIFLGVGGVLGYLSNLIELAPLAVLAPILIYVAMQITLQAFEATPPRHLPAVVFAFFPAIARMLAIKLGDPSIVPQQQFDALYARADQGLPELAVIVILGNGFIITSMVWASVVAALVDGRLRVAAGVCLVGAALTLFGIIHSVVPDGTIYLPWLLSTNAQQLVYPFVGAYVALAAVFGILSLQPQSEAGAQLSSPPHAPAPSVSDRRRRAGKRKRR
jgi:AGZA family xanthine/uracil permease-like MFS transporter